MNGQFLFKKKLGSGGFGEVWSCVDILAESHGGPTDEEENIYAMKIENLVEPSEKEKLAGAKKKVPVP